MSRAEISTLILIALTLLTAMLYAGPKYNVWKSKLRGEAELRQAEYNRQIEVEEAQARLSASKLLADAEVERAKGVAEANLIIGDSLQNNDAYIKYLWVQTLANGENSLVYIPTEANLPILEAR